MGTTKRKRGERYPVEHIAKELGVDRKALERRLDAKSVDSTQGITFREAFSAWTAKDERDADRARQQKADADSAEVDAAHKVGDLMFKKDGALLWADATIELRKLVQSQPKWESEKLLAGMAKIEVET